MPRKIYFNLPAQLGKGQIGPISGSNQIEAIILNFKVYQDSQREHEKLNKYVRINLKHIYGSNQKEYNNNCDKINEIFTNNGYPYIQLEKWTGDLSPARTVKRAHYSITCYYNTTMNINEICITYNGNIVTNEYNADELRQVRPEWIWKINIDALTAAREQDVYLDELSLNSGMALARDNIRSEPLCFATIYKQTIGQIDAQTGTTIIQKSMSFRNSMNYNYTGQVE